MTLIAISFGSYELRKPWLDKCLKTPVSEDPLEKQHVKRDQTVFKYEPQHLNVFFDQVEGN